MTTPQAEMKCPKCVSEMEVGYMLDHTYGNLIASIRIEGLPERNFFRFAKIKSKHMYRINAHRCTYCGILEKYAADQWTGWPKM